jgi:hypothetical protein
MARMNRAGNAEVPDKHSDNARRRTKPADCRPYSPARIEAIYSKGKTLPLGKGGETHEHQKNQFPEDRHDNAKGRYHNDVADGWLRGSGVEGAAARPTFDRGRLDPSGRPPKPATGLKASGQDMTKSPFSAAHRTYSED